MAWGATILKLPRDIRKLEDLPNDFQISPIGNSKDIYAVFKNLFPRQEHVIEGQTIYVDETCYVEFNYDFQGIVDSIGVRSNAGENAMFVMKIFCESMKLTLIDHQSGQIANFDEVTKENMNAYREWSKRALQV